MVATEPKTERNLDIYGAPPIEWGRVREVLEEAGRMYSLATTTRDGSPHARPVGAIYVDGRFYFTSGPGPRKSKNIEENPRVVLSTTSEPFDIAVHGVARRVTEDDKLEQIAKVYTTRGWPTEPRDGGLWAEFSAPSAGPPPWHVYEVTADQVFAFGISEPYGAEKFEF